MDTDRCRAGSETYKLLQLRGELFKGMKVEGPGGGEDEHLRRPTQTRDP